jgi:hypothetical protein
MALYHRERGVLLANLRPSSALRDLRRAVALNPADVAALRALAMTSSRAGDETAARDAATMATEVRPLSPENWLVLALVSRGDAAADAASEALLLAPWLAGSPAWPGELGAPSLFQSRLVSADQPAGFRKTTPDATSVVWLHALTGTQMGRPVAAWDAALQQVLTCDLDGARSAFATFDSWWATTPSIAARIMLARLTGDPATADLLSIAALRQPDLAAAAQGRVDPYSAFASLTEDPQLYRRSGIGPVIDQLVLPRAPDALGSWMVAPRETAARAMPGSALASCP